jgi:pimeloyl-ACP methyl ester carboxylesterase
VLPPTARSHLWVALATAATIGAGHVVATVAPAPRAAPTKRAGAALRAATAAPAGVTETEADEAPTLRWRRCGDGVGECALLAVPLDHGAPDGRLVGMGVRRIAATSPRRRLGVLVVNPGGPGRPAVDDLAAMWRAMRAAMPAVTERFDVVALDVRGTGWSGPRPSCGSRRPVEDVDRCFDPGGAGCWRELADAARDRAQMCARSVERDLLVGMTQENAARDLDVLRAALGEKSLSFYGFSAAARFGGLYATLHPEHLRAAVFDSPASPTHSRAESYQMQAVAYAKAADRFLAWCAEGGRCGARRGEGVDAFAGRAAVALRQRPFVRDAGGTAGGAVLAGRVGHVVDRLRRGSWMALAGELAALTADDPHPMDAAIAVEQRGATPGMIGAWGTSWQGMVDEPVAGRAAEWSWGGRVPRWSGLFEVAWRMNLVSIGAWALPMAAQRSVSARSAAPALVIIGQHDPATPPAAGAAFVDALHGRAWTVRWGGEGHARSLDDACLARAVEAYLLAPGAAPAAARCGG